ncbi:unnamed protein product, partial [Discosporangium mesarthrocarpum]
MLAQLQLQPSGRHNRNRNRNRNRHHHETVIQRENLPTPGAPEGLEAPTLWASTVAEPGAGAGARARSAPWGTPSIPSGGDAGLGLDVDCDEYDRDCDRATADATSGATATSDADSTHAPAAAAVVHTCEDDNVPPPGPRSVSVNPVMDAVGPGLERRGLDA